MMRVVTWMMSCCWSRGMDSRAFCITRQPYICRARGCTWDRSWGTEIFRNIFRNRKYFKIQNNILEAKDRSHCC